MMAFLAIARGTLRELLRTRITLLPLVLLGLALLASVLVQAQDTPSGNADLATALVDVFAVLALLVAAAAGCGQVSEEVDHGTILLLGVRPVRRGTIVAAKLLGAWTYASLALLSWSAVVGGMFAVRGFGSEAAVAALQAGVLRLPTVALIVAIAVFASTLLGTRMAFGFTIMAWLVGWFSGQAHELFEADEPILSWVSGLAPVVEAMTWVVPLRRLDDWASSVTGTLASGLVSATGVELPVIYGSGSDAAWGGVAIAAWALAAVVVFRLRRSLA